MLCINLYLVDIIIIISSSSSSSSISSSNNNNNNNTNNNNNNNNNNNSSIQINLIMTLVQNMITWFYADSVVLCFSY